MAGRSRMKQRRFHRMPRARSCCSRGTGTDDLLCSNQFQLELKGLFPPRKPPRDQPRGRTSELLRQPVSHINTANMLGRFVQSCTTDHTPMMQQRPRLLFLSLSLSLYVALSLSLSLSRSLYAPPPGPRWIEPQGFGFKNKVICPHG